jgi:hypothetical protein
LIGAMILINDLAKACFMQGLVNERIQTIRWQWTTIMADQHTTELPL